MPELPDVEVYLDALRVRLAGERLERVRLASPFLLRTVDPPLAGAEGRRIGALRRIGKRIAIGLDSEPGTSEGEAGTPDGGRLWLVLHLMIAGRLRWRERGATPPRRIGLAAFDFAGGTLLLTEAGTKRRASLHVVDDAGLAGLDPGGIEPLEAEPETFRAALTRRVHTLKRALTDPSLLSGIGNAYSDEILHRARLSPVTWTSRLSDEEIARLRRATRDVLREWTERLRAEAAGEFPERVTPFREGMAVHGRFGQPCPACGDPVQRIRYAEREANYCATCQTDGRVLADRALSRLLGEDWPRTLEALEALRAGDDA